MKTVIIDDEHHAISELTYYLKKLNIDKIASFTSAEEGYQFVASEKPDVVFLDVNMPGINGMDLGRQIYQNNKEISIVYITAHPNYALESFSAHPVDFILKPIDEARLTATVNLIHSKLNNRQKIKHSLTVKCLGKFKVFSGDDEVKFPTSKAKELLAYLITHCGNIVTKEEIVNEIFNTSNNKKDSNHYRVSLFRLRHALQDAHIERKELFLKDDFTIEISDNVCDFIDIYRFTKANTMIDKNNIKAAMHLINRLNDELLTDIDAIWVEEVRAAFITLTEDILWKTALYFIETSENLKAEYVLLKLLDLNPISEIGYTSILDVCIATHNKGKFLHYYKRYQKIMNEELQCAPDKKYRQLFEKIT